MRYEPLTAAHISGLQRLWNTEWGHSFPMRERLLVQNVLEDRNVVGAGTRVAIDEATGELAGYVVAKRWQDSIGGLDYGSELGWIHALLVAPAYRGQGIGSKLLSEAESVLRDRGAKQIQIGSDFHMRVFPGVPMPCDDVSAWLEKRGYVNQRLVFDLFREYEDADAEPLPERESVLFRPLKADEADSFNAFMRRCFPGWVYQTLHYWQRGGDGREFVVCEKDGEIIGFCRINDSHSPILAQNIYWSPLFEQELGGIGPLGIDERYRGHGYGLDIVKAGVHHLHRRGIRNIVIDMTPFVDFYGKLGFQTWRSYVSFRKRFAEAD
ncbi:GNAT family N-acetyltransferase [Paenibacillus sp. NPDC056579]|uniref:GNAT family N-acetyltransferase n=1 Tax=Paenibacillus sp. NPDC056579 TaxID=3345871 RepID=UPI0036A1C7BE